jgi:hypothetical protein
MIDLFSYPDSPGYKEKGGTSEAAADQIASRAHTLRGKALQIFRELYPDGSTADGIALRVGVTVLAMRPRITELYKFGLIEKTDFCRLNKSGVRARVWRYRQNVR